MTVFEQRKAERDTMNLERIADSLKSIDTVLREIAKMFESQLAIERPEEGKE